MAWAILYLIGYVGLLAWTRRADFRRRATAIPAALDVGGGICLSVPALAWLDEDVATWCPPMLLPPLFILGLISTAWFCWEGVRKVWTNPYLAPPQRGRFAAITLAAALVGAGPDVWWGALAVLRG
jgi:hypothetical protein